MFFFSIFAFQTRTARNASFVITGKVRPRSASFPFSIVSFIIAKIPGFFNKVVEPCRLCKINCANTPVEAVPTGRGNGAYRGRNRQRISPQQSKYRCVAPVLSACRPPCLEKKCSASQGSTRWRTPLRQYDSRLLTEPPIVPRPRKKLACSATGGAALLSPSC